MNYLARNQQWLALMAGSFTYFETHREELRAVQQRKLRHYLQANADTVYGREYGFARIRDYADYAIRVPIIEDWVQIRPYIERIAAREPKILTAEAVLAFEETSGSTSASKLIPFTDTLRKEFQDAVGVWMNVAYQKMPEAFAGPAFWSLSPALKAPRVSAGGLPIGLPSDLAYFDESQMEILGQILVYPPDLAGMMEADAYYFTLWVYLLQQEALSFVSVWSPAYLIQLQRFFEVHRERILAAVRPHISESRWARLTGPCTWKEIWPQLHTLSCWTHAQARSWLPELQQILGDLIVQPKGLLSTEGITSIPYAPDHDPVLAYTSHFYEFRHIGTERLYLAHELKTAQEYEVILTTGGGLYRYASGDVVQVRGHVATLPCLRFQGRKGLVSDLVGEKISEHQVIAALSHLRTRLPLVHAWLYPEKRKAALRYHLLVEGEIPDDALARLTEHLCQNPYVRQALDTRQLHSFVVDRVAQGFHEEVYRLMKQQRQIKDGDAKVPVLLRPGVLERLLGY